MLELGQLRAFVAVAEELHFGRGAARLNMTQPPVSRQVRLLEHIVEARLLDRSSHHVALTAAGEAFLPEARRILQLAESAVLAVKRTVKGEIGVVSIGFTASTGYDFLPSVMRLLKEVLPDVDFHLREGVTHAQLEQLSAGSLDVALVRPPVREPQLQSRTVLREPLMVALPGDHPLARHPCLELEMLKTEPIIGYSQYEARYFHDLVSNLFRDEKVSPNFVQHVSQIHSILALVRVGLGIAFVPAAASRLHFEEVAYRPIRTQRPHPVTLVLAWRRDESKPVARRTTDVILDHAAMLGSDGR